MTYGFRFLLSIFLLGSFFLGLEAQAQIQWDEPLVLPKRLRRKDRQVVSFSGKTEAYALVRIKDDRLKVYWADGSTHWAKMPQKDRGQFPVQAHDDGRFSFFLYLPIAAVEIPVEVKTDKGWESVPLTFKVPDPRVKGVLEDMEEGLKALDEQGRSTEDHQNEESPYGKAPLGNQGLRVKTRGGHQDQEMINLSLWLGAGVSFFDTSTATRFQEGLHIRSQASSLNLPIFRLGFDWIYSPSLTVKGSLRSTSGTTEDISINSSTAIPVNSKDFNWNEVQLGVVWFMDSLRGQKGDWGLDMGLQSQQLPFFRDREGALNHFYMGHDLYSIHLGFFYQTHFDPKKERALGYEAYGRYLYPLGAGTSTFLITSSLPFHFELGGGVKVNLGSGLTLGVFGQLHYISMATEYFNQDVLRSTDLSLNLFSTDVRLMTRF